MSLDRQQLTGQKEASDLARYVCIKAFLSRPFYQGIYHMAASTTPSQTATIDPDEIERFSALAETWWDPKGPMAPLHKFNPTRLSYLRLQIARHFNRDPDNVSFADGLRGIDIGCGGGLITEPMARFGAKMLGVDAAEKNVKTAQTHAAQHCDSDKIALSYRHCSAEDLVAEGQKFDFVLSLEVIEHVADVPLFLQSISHLVAPGGLVILSTLNRTLKSLALAKIGAEYILGWLPKGTHDWQKFIKPSELENMMHTTPLALTDLRGLSYHPLRDEWHLSQDVSMNYMMVFKER